jgi:hypothetical protein
VARVQGACSAPKTFSIFSYTLANLQNSLPNPHFVLAKSCSRHVDTVTAIGSGVSNGMAR